jgi:hypothetical protein
VADRNTESPTNAQRARTHFMEMGCFGVKELRCVHSAHYDVPRIRGADQFFDRIIYLLTKRPVPFLFNDFSPLSSLHRTPVCANPSLVDTETGATYNFFQFAPISVRVLSEGIARWDCLRKCLGDFFSPLLIGIKLDVVYSNYEKVSMSRHRCAEWNYATFELRGFRPCAIAAIIAENALHPGMPARNIKVYDAHWLAPDLFGSSTSSLDCDERDYVNRHDIRPDHSRRNAPSKSGCPVWLLPIL